MHVANIADLVWFVATDLPSPGHALKNYLGRSGDGYAEISMFSCPIPQAELPPCNLAARGEACANSSGEREQLFFSFVWLNCLHVDHILKFSVLNYRNILYSSQNAGFREDNGTPLQYSCLENPMSWGVWTSLWGYGRPWKDFIQLSEISRYRF